MNHVDTQRRLLADTVDRLFHDLACSQEEDERRSDHDGAWTPAAWQAIEDNGLPPLLVPEAMAGFGGNLQDACVVARAAGYHGLALPLSETILAHKLLRAAGQEAPVGPIAFAGVGAMRIDAVAGAAATVHGQATRVPWGDVCGHVLVVSAAGAEWCMGLVAATHRTVTRRTLNIAGEPLADLDFKHAPVVAYARLEHDPCLLAALLRACAMAGALDATLQMSVAHANERVQFGRSIGKFQVIQHALATLATETAAADCAARAACQAVDGMDDALFEVACAKLRANLAAGVGTSIAHQVHGAIGFTREHGLRRATQRLMAWRSQDGNDRYWSRRIGLELARIGADAFWANLTDRSDRGAA